jgi:hypothetical protein
MISESTGLLEFSHLLVTFTKHVHEGRMEKRLTLNFRNQRSKTYIDLRKTSHPLLTFASSLKWKSCNNWVNYLHGPFHFYILFEIVSSNYHQKTNHSTHYKKGMLHKKMFYKKVAHCFLIPSSWRTYWIQHYFYIWQKNGYYTRRVTCLWKLCITGCIGL